MSLYSATLSWFQDNSSVINTLNVVEIHISFDPTNSLPYWSRVYKNKLHHRVYEKRVVKKNIIERKLRPDMSYHYKSFDNQWNLNPKETHFFEVNKRLNSKKGDNTSLDVFSEYRICVIKFIAWVIQKHTIKLPCSQTNVVTTGDSVLRDRSF